MWGKALCGHDCFIGGILHVGIQLFRDPGMHRGKSARIPHGNQTLDQMRASRHLINCQKSGMPEPWRQAEVISRRRPVDQPRSIRQNLGGNDALGGFHDEARKRKTRNATRQFLSDVASLPGLWWRAFRNSSEVAVFSLSYDLRNLL